MKSMAWRWTLAASALALLITACTVTSDDDNDEDGGEDGGTGGATGGTGGATGGTGGATGGTGGATGGTGGATGGTGGGGTTCADLLPEEGNCGPCMKTNCCTETEACGKNAVECWPAFKCLFECEKDFETCKNECAEFVPEYNDAATCMETKCFDKCASS